MARGERVVLALAVLGLLGAVSATLCGTSASDSFSRGATDRPLCLIYNQTQFMVFYPEVDDFVQLDIFNSSNLAYQTEYKSSLQIELGGVVSPNVTWHQGNLTVPFFTALVTVNNGVISNIEWDLGCFYCLPDVCLDRNCAVEGCEKQGNTCDIRIYIGWLGTDANGNFLTSAGRRFSAFRRYGINDYYATAVQGVTDSFDGEGNGVTN